MITRASSVVAIEGPAVLPETGPDEEPVRRRIEIDLYSGRIREVGEPRGTGDLVLEDDCILLPGLIDVHVHAREDPTSQESYKETFHSAGEAAIHGGVTAFADMPNNPSPPVDDASYRAKKALARSAPVDVLLYAGIGPGTRPLSFSVPYKAYMGPSVGRLFFDSYSQLRDTLSRYSGSFVAFHAESPDILRACAGARRHEERRPPEAEIEAVRFALELAAEFRLEAHICHLSTAGGLELIREARNEGLPVTCEVTPHHLYYDLDNAENFARPSYLQANPPLRSRLDRIALIDGLKKGDIDYLATDHAPHTIEEKEEGASGVPHLDTFGPFLFWLREEGFSWSRIAACAAAAPGRFFSRFTGEPRGKIAPRFLGSLTVLRNQPVTIRRRDLRTRAGWSPFEGVTFAGRVEYTVVRGRIHPQAS